MDSSSQISNYNNNKNNNSTSFNRGDYNLHSPSPNPAQTESKTTYQKVINFNNVFLNNASKIGLKQFFSGIENIVWGLTAVPLAYTYNCACGGASELAYEKSAMANYALRPLGFFLGGLVGATLGSFRGAETALGGVWQMASPLTGRHKQSDKFVDECINNYGSSLSIWEEDSHFPTANNPLTLAAEDLALIGIQGAKLFGLGWLVDKLTGSKESTTEELGDYSFPHYSIHKYDSDSDSDSDDGSNSFSINNNKNNNIDFTEKMSLEIQKNYSRNIDGNFQIRTFSSDHDEYSYVDIKKALEMLAELKSSSNNSYFVRILLIDIVQAYVQAMKDCELTNDDTSNLTNKERSSIKEALINYNTYNIDDIEIIKKLIENFK